ncbi:hypothetical protein BDZ85DRAFT_257264 [Elsinoe ampelina]|uniref:Secreted protein n=1 Tax=Elsinoe ampelina TaxID=302913 RepID=A0A6A6GN33_9PEZI|nr:hypothetical protein BDZ85DRAFT_257264 [Elsinoe ampelina]
MGCVCWVRMLMGIACGSPGFCFLNQAIRRAQSRSGLGSTPGRDNTTGNWSKQVSCLQDHYPSLLCPISVATPVVSTYHFDHEGSETLRRSYTVSWQLVQGASMTTSSSLIPGSIHTTAKRGGTCRVMGLVPIGHVI